jgi:hypothetical protein
MKRKIITTTAFVFSFMICVAFTLANLDGKWTGSLKTPDGNEFPLSYTFKLDGDKLTGSAAGPNGETPISDGKVNGSDFTFNLDVNGAAIGHTCKYYSVGDSIAVDINFNGNKMHTQLKRATN